MEDFEAYVAANAAALARTAYLLTGDRQLAEDVLQDALASVAKRWASVCRAGDPDPYVRRALYNRAVDRWRSRRRRPESPTDDIASWPELQSADDPEEAVVRRVVLLEALNRLTPRQRAVLVLRFYEDRTETQTASLMGCSVNTVKSQTRHALDRLRTLAPELVAAFASSSEEGPP